MEGTLKLLDGSFVYDGEAKSLAIAGALPDGVTASYKGNGRAEAGTHTIIALIDGGKNHEDLTLTATLEITPTRRTLVGKTTGI